MSDLFVPDSFAVPRQFAGPGFRFEPLGPEHNERDYKAWTSSVEHIRETPGFEERDWPAPMTLDENLADLVRHAADFDSRTGFTYSIIDGDEVIGCVYIYPSWDPDYDAAVASWVRKTRSEMDRMIWQEVSQWLATVWPFDKPSYADR